MKQQQQQQQRQRRRRWRRRGWQQQRGSVSGPSAPSLLQPPLQPRAPSLQLAGPSSAVPGERKQDQRRPETISLGPLALARLLAGSCSLSLWLESSLPPALKSSWGGVGSCPRLGWWEPCVQQRKPGGPGPSQPSADECQGAERAEAGPAALSPEPDLCFPQRQWRQQRRSPQLRRRWWHLHHAGGTAALPVFFIHAGADCPGHSHLLSPRAVPLHFPHPQA